MRGIQEYAPAGRLPFRVKLGYGGAESAGSLIWTVFYTYFLFYLTDVVKMDPGLAGLVMMVGSIWQAVFTPLAGVFSDTRRWRWGRRRPFLLALAAPYGVISWLLFTDLGLSSTWTAVYVLATVILYFTAYTLLDVPYTALGAEMTQGLRRAHQPGHLPHGLESGDDHHRCGRPAGAGRRAHFLARQ